MAEGVGFEPTEPCGSPVFKTGALDRSATPPCYLLRSIYGCFLNRHFCVCNPIVFGMNQMPKKSQEFNKVAECLYRNGNRLYYALVKVNGKQIRRSLKTNDLAIAKRRLMARGSM